MIEGAVDAMIDVESKQYEGAGWLNLYVFD